MGKKSRQKKLRRDRGQKPKPTDRITRTDLEKHFDLLPGEIIELLRDKEAMVMAGETRKIPLPPKGRIVYPKVSR